MSRSSDRNFLGECSGKGGERCRSALGGLGYSVERWVWWKERWGQLAAADGLGEDGRANAREALEAMREAEGSS
jgi:hypothetical protein